jgi:hypothetical protein
MTAMPLLLFFAIKQIIKYIFNEIQLKNLQLASKICQIPYSISISFSLPNSKGKEGSHTAAAGLFI